MSVKAFIQGLFATTTSQVTLDEDFEMVEVVVIERTYHPDHLIINKGDSI